MRRALPAHCSPRGRVRTWVLSLGSLVVLGGAILLVLFKSLGPPEPQSAGTPTPAAPDAISGTVTVAADLQIHVPDDAVLFVIARKSAGPPFAVLRIAQPRFPQPFRIGPENVMMAGTPFEGAVHIAARLSRSGTAGPAQPGDLEGELAKPVPVGSGNVTVTLTQVR